MPDTITRRAFGASVAVALATPFIRRADAAAPIELRCSLDTAPSHPRNVAVRDFLSKVEAASNGQITTKLFESGSLFPDLQVVKALVQGQVEMACPGTWTITGFVPDADFSQLPALYGRPLDAVHKATDGKGGKFVNQEITNKLHIEVLGGWFDLGFNNWFSTRKPLNSLADLAGMKLRSPGGVLNSFRIRFFGGIANVTAWPDVPLAMSQGTFDGLISTNESTRSSKLYDSGMRYSLQDRQGMGLYVPLVNQAFWTKIGPKMQEAMLKIWADNLPGWRANSAQSQENARKELTQHDVKFVDVSQPELDATHAKLLKEQDKAVADAHISPELVKLVMADVGV
ncbi:MAG TPA: TRAP transporter substrate-binding protein DctP [Acetobacteraceae bacterium]|jgi:TRAP-type transport system periplasmic protein|nr:TRAP transporter substrate-binding protein DctP [Acetobacteraceae bacterium]